MKKLTKQNQEQNYLVLPAMLLKVWFDRMHQEQFGALVAQPKALPAGQTAKTEKKLDINFSDWDLHEHKPEMLIEEYLWGIRYGVMQYIDVERCSFAEVLEIAKTDDMSELYSPAKVQYFSDGTRKVIPQNLSVYNTDVKFGCWYLINIEQAKHFFPQYTEVFDGLPPETKFLCSKEMDKLRIASQENGEIGFSFSAVDTKIKDIGFYLGNLRPSFQYIAREVGVGGGAAFCDPKQMKNLDYLQSKIGLMCGGKYPYSLAENLVSEELAEKLKEIYLKEGVKGKEDFCILIDGSYLDADSGINHFVEKDGTNIQICVPPSVYQSWGKDFTAEELEIIYKRRTYNFDASAENDYFSKINRLRFSQREIYIFAEAKPSQKIVEVEPLREIIHQGLDEIETNEQNLIKEIAEERRRAEEERRRRAAEEERRCAEEEERRRAEEERRRAEERRREEIAHRFSARDLSGPSRSSLYTGFF